MPGAIKHHTNTGDLTAARSGWKDKYSSFLAGKKNEVQMSFALWDQAAVCVPKWPQLQTSSVQGKENTSFLQSGRTGYFWVSINCLCFPVLSLIPYQGNMADLIRVSFQQNKTQLVNTNFKQKKKRPRVLFVYVPADLLGMNSLEVGAGRSRAIGVIRENEPWKQGKFSG